MTEAEEKKLVGAILEVNMVIKFYLFLLKVLIIINFLIFFIKNVDGTRCKVEYPEGLEGKGDIKDHRLSIHET